MGYNLTFEKLVELLARAAKAPVKVASQAPLGGYLPSPPRDRFPNVSVVDGETLGIEDRVLVRAEVNPAHNGLYEYVEDLSLIPEGTTPNPGSGLIRSIDADVTGDLVPGALIPITKGTDFDKVFILTWTGQDVPVIGVHGLTFAASGLVGGLPGVLALSNETGGNDLRISSTDTLRFVETGGGSDSVGFRGPTAVTTDLTWILPSNLGGSGTFLRNDGAGNLSWQTVPGASLSYNAGENITVGQLLAVEWDAVNSEVRVYRARANDPSLPRRRVLGVALNSAATGVSVSVQAQEGSVVTVGFGAAPAATDNGKPVFLSTSAGSPSLSAPAGTGLYIFQVGILVGADGLSANVSVLFRPTLIAAT